MDKIIEVYESTPTWALLMLIGAIIAIMVISALKKNVLFGFLIIAFLIYAFFNPKVQDYFAQYNGGEIIDSQAIESFGDEIIEKDKSGILNRIFGKEKIEPEETLSPSSDEFEDDMGLTDNDSPSYGFNEDAFAKIKQGFSELFTKK